MRRGVVHVLLCSLVLGPARVCHHANRPCIQLCMLSLHFVSIFHVRFSWRSVLYRPSVGAGSENDVLVQKTTCMYKSVWHAPECAPRLYTAGNCEKWQCLQYIMAHVCRDGTHMWWCGADRRRVPPSRHWRSSQTANAYPSTYVASGSVQIEFARTTSWAMLWCAGSPHLCACS